MTKPIYLILWTLSFVFSALSAQTMEDFPVEYNKVGAFSIEDLRRVWEEYDIPELIAPLNNGVDLYTVEYHSTGIHNKKVKASGLLFLPQGLSKPPSVILYHHGTRILKGLRPTLRGERVLCTTFAADGYAVVMPDYLGLGSGEGKHLYLHVETEAQASIDMMRSVRKVCEEIKQELGEQLFLTGYSQGGHATLSAHKIMEERYPEEFKITASSPMSGPYDLYGIQGRDMFNPYDWPSYLPYLMLSYQEVYQFFDDPSKIFQPPYDTLLPPLFDGSIRLTEIDRLLPTVPAKMIRPELIQAYESNPDFPFRKALKENSLTEWNPKVPVQFCYCKSDEAVNYRNSVNAFKSMKSRGLDQVRLRQSGKKFGHVTCVVFASIYSKWFFDSFRDDTPGRRKGGISKRLLVSLFKLKLPGLKKERRKKHKKQRKLEKQREKEEDGK